MSRYVRASSTSTPLQIYSHHGSSWQQSQRNNHKKTWIEPKNKRLYDTFLLVIMADTKKYVEASPYRWPFDGKMTKGNTCIIVIGTTNVVGWEAASHRTVWESLLRKIALLFVANMKMLHLSYCTHQYFFCQICKSIFALLVDM